MVRPTIKRNMVLNAISGKLLRARINYRIANGWTERVAYKKEIYSRLVNLYHNSSVLADQRGRK